MTTSVPAPSVPTSAPFSGPRGLWRALVDAAQRNAADARVEVLALRFGPANAPVAVPPVPAPSLFGSPEGHEPAVVDLAALDCLSR